MENFDLLSALAGILIKISISYILLGLFTLIAVEAITSFFNLRSKFLYQSMKENFNDDEMVQFIYNHPFIKVLGQNSSYINRKIFSHVLMDYLKITNVSEFLKSATDKTSAYYKNNFVHALCVFSRSASSVEDVRKNASYLFNDFVHKISNGYKRKIQAIILVVATVLVISMNIDTIKLFNAISKNTLTKNVLETLSKNKALPDSTINILDNLTPNAYPVGWSIDSLHQFMHNQVATIIGWFITIFFASFAAQFIYTRYINVRTTAADNKTADDD